MSITNSLLILVNSLTKAEKRHFTLLSGLQSGEKVYLSLFNLIDGNISDKELYALFCEKLPGKSYDMAAKHLYRNLLDCLVRLREKQDVQTQIFNQISIAGILFEREMFDEAFAELDKAKTLASTYENDSLQLLVRRTELKYLNMLDFRGLNERQLVNKQMKINEVTKYSRNLNQHLQLYEILRHRLIHKGYARSDKQKESLNDLVLSELHLIGNSSYQGFEAEKLHLLFQSSYYLNSGNYKLAIRYYKEIIDLFGKNEQLIQNPPIYYLSAIQGVLDSLEITRLYAEMSFFIDKLREIEQGSYAKEFVLYVKSLIYLYEQNRFMQTGDFESALFLKKENEDSLFKKTALLALEPQLKLLLNSVVLYMYVNDLPQARKYMKKILSSGKQFYMLPSYNTARLVNLLLQAELKNLLFLENEISAIKRSIRYEKETNITEKIIFKFLRDYPLPSYEKARNRLWELYKKDFTRIKNDKYEMKLRKTFNVLAWIRHKLTHQSLADILAENAGE
ncbi:hypothetical protein [Massilibacteroides sp.]|uniref:hypothetical protein n=1 Tax=Massilibacteroides sp. TaxID=2034766 RepID=UPI002625F5CE|nr:hypothetical protein [Massilibacteroides sp.]MDD4514025.1 hypothetical protein [Massilibacteroides sp.]